jgi:hypothetical protein
MMEITLERHGECRSHRPCRYKGRQGEEDHFLRFDHRQPAEEEDDGHLGQAESEGEEDVAGIIELGARKKVSISHGEDEDGLVIHTCWAFTSLAAGMSSTDWPSPFEHAPRTIDDWMTARSWNIDRVSVRGLSRRGWSGKYRRDGDCHIIESESRRDRTPDECSDGREEQEPAQAQCCANYNPRGMVCVGDFVERR